MQIALGAASVVVEILLLLLFIWVVYDIVAGTFSSPSICEVASAKKLVAPILVV